MKQGPQWIYEEVYCQRGEIENRIKELKALDVDRTSCTSFWAQCNSVVQASVQCFEHGFLHCEPSGQKRMGPALGHLPRMLELTGGKNS
jgi:hypothetical protein